LRAGVPSILCEIGFLYCGGDSAPQTSIRHFATHNLSAYLFFGAEKRLRTFQFCNASFAIAAQTRVLRQNKQKYSGKKKPAHLSVAGLNPIL
jgi:hypothetical protein